MIIECNTSLCICNITNTITVSLVQCSYLAVTQLLIRFKRKCNKNAKCSERKQSRKQWFRGGRRGEGCSANSFSYPMLLNTVHLYIYIYFYLSYFKNTKDEYKLKLFVEKKTDGNSYTLCSTQFSFICIVPFYNNIPHKVLYSVK